VTRRSTIRRAAAGDAVDIAATRVASWRAAYAGIVPAEILERMDARRYAPSLEKRLGEPDHGILVTLGAEGRIEGYAITGPSRDSDVPGLGEVEAIYLAPESRGTGLGAPLLEAACASLAARGFEVALLWVLTANDAARRFYERAGFVRDGGARVLDFDGTPIEEIRYRRPARPR
jgi:ribosomal protein S18 acetylase RimI-like enzyme